MGNGGSGRVIVKEAAIDQWVASGVYTMKNVYQGRVSGNWKAAGA